MIASRSMLRRDHDGHPCRVAISTPRTVDVGCGAAARRSIASTVERADCRSAHPADTGARPGRFAHAVRVRSPTPEHPRLRRRCGCAPPAVLVLHSSQAVVGTPRCAATWNGQRRRRTCSRNWCYPRLGAATTARSSIAPGGTVAHCAVAPTRNISATCCTSCVGDRTDPCPAIDGVITHRAPRVEGAMRPPPRPGGATGAVVLWVDGCGKIDI